MSKIEWTERTWNPIVGCSIVSPGCTNCYAMKMAARLEAMAREHAGQRDNSTQPLGPLAHYLYTTQRSKAGAVWTGKVALAPEHILLEPLRRKKPTTYFVNSMGDLFHEDIPDAWIDKVFAVMALTPQHTYQVLTKRSARMLEFLTSSSVCYRLAESMVEMPAIRTVQPFPNLTWPTIESAAKLAQWPLPNVWLGVSAERQQEADARIPDLLATPAAVRFISCEPLLGPIDLTNIAGQVPEYGTAKAHGIDALSPYNRILRPQLDWVIVGGESGTGARPMHPDWARSLRDQCQAADVAFFFKQWGSWIPIAKVGTGGTPAAEAFPDHHVWNDSTVSRRVAKSVAGRLLDGRTWDEMPGKPEKDQAA